MSPREIISDLRSRGMTIKQIAEAAGCSIWYVSKIQNGERKEPSYVIVDRLREFHKNLA